MRQIQTHLSSLWDDASGGDCGAAQEQRTVNMSKSRPPRAVRPWELSRRRLMIPPVDGDEGWIDGHMWQC